MSALQEHLGFVAPDTATLAPLFPGYEIEGLIATGGMGAVYCAQQKSLDRTVALKILPKELSKDAAFCAGFEAEAKAMARLNHPNLIGVFDFGEVGGMLFIIMEFVAGKSIFHSAHGIALDQEEVLRLVTGICSGLAHAHENGIMHRDIKPANILLDLNAQPKIGDFGLARPIERKLVEGEEIFGTPHYTAPEVVDTPHSVDFRADIFSVGVMLHELLTGKLPAHDPRSPSMIARCDVRFDAIVKKATQRLPAARYTSTAELLQDLQAVSQSLQQKVHRVSPVVAPRRPRRVGTYAKPRKSSSSSLVIFLLIAAAGGAYFFLSKPTLPAVALPVLVIPAPVEVAPAEESLPDIAMPTVPKAAPVPARPQNTTAFGSERSGSVDGPEAPETVAVAAPKADVKAFFERARKIMQDRSKTLISTYHSKLSGNSSDFQRAFALQVRKMRSDDSSSTDKLEEAVADLKKTGGKIPAHLTSSAPAMNSIFSDFRQRQTGIEDALHQSLSGQSALYLVGLQREIERLEAKDDSGAVALLKEEIELTKDSPEYFTELMLGTAGENEE